ncbi:helix-turn-helix domain-containing protein [Thalassotalea psychrophila]|uniref:Helix-turn-helix domain-containing protein n=1 Tax=Thalassotalea psychrophila TaxID=3065647 RepID=A0ABY9TTB8_9GAMM|nr:helix-turn-helix domain-containing protein [Colwelliaceae bacterium SQ149]
MQNKQLLQSVNNYFQAWNNADAKAVAAFFSEDAVYIDTAQNKEYRGKEIEQYIARTVAGTAQKIEFSIVQQPVINGDVVFLQSSLKIKSAQESQHLESAELIKFSHGKISMLQTYYNLDQDITAPALEKDKYAKSGLDQAQTKVIKTKLEAIMAQQEPFRDSSLKLQDLTEMLDIRRNHLSQILNNEYQMKFFDFINHYRLQAFLKSLHNCDSSEVNITELAYEAGFSSSSVFYKIFKRYQEISPSQYLKNIQQSEIK